MTLFSTPAAVRWPLRAFAVAVIVLALGVWLFPAAKTALLIGVALSGAWLAWTWWDATRGEGAAVDAVRARFAAALAPAGAVENGPDLHLFEVSQPLLLRVGRRGRATATTLLTPLRESTTAFRIWPRAMPRPSFDGSEPPVGGPMLTHLPALETVLGGGFSVEGNEPTHIMRYLDEALLSALLDAERSYPAAFRGLTFDGRFLAVHWLGGVAGDPQRVVRASSLVWRPFVPRLPPVPSSLMH
ncbi:MAG: hypothetical protein U1F43_32790 [Myxococcota bacterium]